MAVKTRGQLNTQALTVKNEVTANANTATRVGSYMEDASDSYAMSTDLTGQPTSNITTGTFADARISESSVTQHEGALSLTASQVTDFDTEVSNNASVAANTAKVSWLKPCEIQISCSDLTTDLVAGTSVAYIRMPYAMTLTEVRASVLTAATGGTLLTVDINEGGVTILSTKLTIDASEKTSTTATTPAVISDSSLADDAEVTIDIDAIGSTIAGAGLIITLIGTRT